MVELEVLPVVALAELTLALAVVMGAMGVMVVLVVLVVEVLVVMQGMVVKVGHLPQQTEPLAHLVPVAVVVAVAVVALFLALDTVVVGEVEVLAY